MSSNNATRAALAVASGLAMGLAFPKFDYGLLAWVSLVPLFYVIEGESMRRVFRWAYLQGFAANVVSLYWIPIPLHDFADVHFAFAIFPMFALAAIVAINSAVAIWAGELVARRMRVPAVLTMPIAWTALEWFRTYVPAVIPVEPARLHGVSQSRIDPVRRIHRSVRRVRADRVLQRRRLRRDFPPRRISPADHQPERVDRDDDRAGRIRRVANQRHQGRAAIGQLQGRDGAGEHPAVAQVGSQVPAAKATACTRTKPPTRRNAAPT